MKTLRVNEHHMRVKSVEKKGGRLIIKTLTDEPIAYVLGEEDTWEVIDHDTTED